MREMANWDHGNDRTGRFRGGKTAAQRKDEPVRKARQQERGEDGHKRFHHGEAKIGESSIPEQPRL